MDAGGGAGAGAPAHADQVEVRGLRLMGVHGVHEEERTVAQPFEVDLDLEVDTRGAAESDDLVDTADYAAVLHAVAAVVAGPPRRLLESLAADIADAALKVAHVRAVVVAVRKLDPPVPYEVRSTGVRIVRRATPTPTPTTAATTTPTPTPSA